MALLEDGRLAELMLDRPDQGRMVGDILLGRVEAVLPGIQAAFVDIGTGKAGFLHASDTGWPEEGEEEEEEDDDAPSPSRKAPPIQDVVSRGEEVLVQVTKEPIGTKGSRLTMEISLPGRFLVYMPFSSHIGVSRKIEERGARARLRKLARDIVPEGEGGVIIRTVGEELNRKTFQNEFERLHGLWKEIRARADAAEAPALVHGEAHLIGGVIRDLFSDKFDSLTVDSEEIHEEVRRYLEGVDPDLVERVRLHEGPGPLFDEAGIEEEIQAAFQRRVDLPSGGHIVIEPTEALVTIDVNTGRFTGRKRKDPEHTILRTNLDAAMEIARQLRLRDIGGIIVCDFIDMESQENRDRVLHELRSHLGRDRARTRTFEISELGLVEMTRQRVRPSLQHSLSEPCPHCGGTGRLFTPATVVRRIDRTLHRVSASGEDRSLLVRVHPEVALQILEREPDFLSRVEQETGLDLDLEDDPLLREDEYRLLSGPAHRDVTERYSPAAD